MPTAEAGAGLELGNAGRAVIARMQKLRPDKMGEGSGQGKEKETQGAQEEDFSVLKNVSAL